MARNFSSSWIPRSRVRGVFVREDAYAAGMTRRQVDHRLARGTWRYLMGRAITHQDLRVDARTALLAVGVARPGSVVLGRYAAAFHGAPVALTGPVDVRLGKAGGSVPAGLRGRFVAIDGDVLRSYGGAVTVTSPRRSYLDALAWMPPDEARSALAYLLTHRRLSCADLTERLDRAPRARGNGQLRWLVERVADGAVSEAEEVAHGLLRGGGVDGWEANGTIVVGGRRYVCDVLFRRERVAVEIDGRRFHEGRFVEDRRRDAHLVAHGWVVLRFSWRDLTDRADDVVAQVSAVLARRRE